MEEEIQKLEGKNKLKQVKVNKNELRELVKKELIVPYIDLRLSIVRKKLSVISQRVATPESPCERCKRCIKCLRCSDGARKKRELEMKIKQAGMGLWWATSGSRLDIFWSSDEKGEAAIPVYLHVSQ